MTCSNKYRPATMILRAKIILKSIRISNLPSIHIKTFTQSKSIIARMNTRTLLADNFRKIYNNTKYKCKRKLGHNKSQKIKSTEEPALSVIKTTKTIQQKLKRDSKKIRLNLNKRTRMSRKLTGKAESNQLQLTKRPIKNF